MTEEQLTREAEAMSQETGLPAKVCREMILIGLKDTKRDKDGRLLADQEDVDAPDEWEREKE